MHTHVNKQVLGDFQKVFVPQTLHPKAVLFEVFNVDINFKGRMLEELGNLEKPQQQRKLFSRTLPSEGLICKTPIIVISSSCVQAWVFVGGKIAAMCPPSRAHGALSQ